MQIVSALEIRSWTANSVPFTVHYTSTGLPLSTKAEGLCAVQASYPESNQEIKTSLLSSEN